MRTSLWEERLTGSFKSRHLNVVALSAPSKVARITSGAAAAVATRAARVMALSMM